MRYHQTQAARAAEQLQYREEYHSYPSYAMTTFATQNHVAPPPPAYDPRYPAPPLYVPPSADGKDVVPTYGAPLSDAGSSGNNEHNASQGPFADHHEIDSSSSPMFTDYSSHQADIAARASTAEEYERATAEPEHELYPPSGTRPASALHETSRRV